MVLVLYRNLVRATSRILCAVLVTTTQEGHTVDATERVQHRATRLIPDRALYTRKEAVTRIYDDV